MMLFTTKTGLKRIVSLFIALVLLISTNASHAWAATPEDRSNINAAFSKKVKDIEADFNVSGLEVSTEKDIMDASGNMYTVVELSPTGYMIYCHELSDFVEYSATAPSPYDGFFDDLLYLGPTEYYHVDGDYFVHTITGEKLVIAEYKEAFENYSVELSKFYQENLKKSGESENQINASQYSNQYISGYQQIKNMISESEMSYCSPSGTNGICGFIAAAITLAWYDTYKNSNIIDDTTYMKYARGYKVFAGNPSDYSHAGSDYKMTLSYNLWKYCSGSNNGSSLPSTIKSTINTYLHVNRSITNLSAYSELLPTTSFIKNQLALQRPVILMGDLSNGVSKKDGHAVVVYGNNGDELIAHFGWGNYSEVVVTGIKGGVVVIG